MNQIKSTIHANHISFFDEHGFVVMIDDNHVVYNNSIWFHGMYISLIIIIISAFSIYYCKQIDYIQYNGKCLSEGICIHPNDNTKTIDLAELSSYFIGSTNIPLIFNKNFNLINDYILNDRNNNQLTLEQKQILKEINIIKYKFVDFVENSEDIFHLPNGVLLNYVAYGYDEIYMPDIMTMILNHILVKANELKGPLNELYTMFLHTTYEYKIINNITQHNDIDERSKNVVLEQFIIHELEQLLFENLFTTLHYTSKIMYYELAQNYKTKPDAMKRLNILYKIWNTHIDQYLLEGQQSCTILHGSKIQYKTSQQVSII